MHLRCRDHPRVGGEKQVPETHVSRTRGSPPRGRGKVCYLYLTHAPEGITPAWAGKRDQRHAGSNPDEDHPRVGGEKYSYFTSCAHVRGSPPRGRGKGRKSLAVIRWEGITPAWAGKSPCRHSGRCRTGDHPRVGGEKPCGAVATVFPGGSPPRGRGKAISQTSTMKPAGITPAWAGKRRLFLLRSLCP